MDQQQQLTNTTLKGLGILHFDGASRQNGPAGFGFSISSASSSSDKRGGRGWTGFNSWILLLWFGVPLWKCNMQLYWKHVFGQDAFTLKNCGFAVMLQPSFHKCRGTSKVSEEDSLVEYFYYTKIQALLEQASEEGTEIDLEQVSKEANVICNVLASLALDLKENATACNWDNINEQCRRSKK